MGMTTVERHMGVTSETELIQRAKAGEQEAFCLLARQYERRIYRLALHYCQNPENAEDLSQEVWLKAWRAIHGFRGESSFYTWLRQITIHTFLNHQRGFRMTMFDKDKKVIRLGELVSIEDLGLAEPSRDAAEELHQQVMVAKVMDQLGELTPQQRLIFLLKHSEGMTYDEISAACDVTAGTIKKALFRAMQKLRGALGIEMESAAAVTDIPARRFQAE